jgi:hypothetical protein
MSNPLAKSIFSAGPKDALAAIDVYKATGQTVINSIQDLERSTGINIDALLNGNLSGISIGAIIKKVSGGISLDPGVLAARLLAASPGLTNTYKNLTSSISGAAQDTLSSISSAGALNTLQVNINGVIQSCSAADFTNVASVGKFVNDTAGSNVFSMIDINAKGSVLSGIVSQASSLGITGVFSQITSAITDNALLMNIVKGSIAAAIRGADLSTILDIALSNVGRSIDAVLPSFFRDLTSSVVYKNDGNIVNTILTYTKLIEILDHSKPGWSVGHRATTAGDESCVDLTLLLGGSADFKNIISNGVHSYVALDTTPGFAARAMSAEACRALAAVLPPAEVFSEIKKSHSGFVPVGNASTSTRVTDPLTLRNLAGVAGITV